MECRVLFEQRKKWKAWDQKSVQQLSNATDSWVNVKILFKFRLVTHFCRVYTRTELSNCKILRGRGFTLQLWWGGGIRHSDFSFPIWRVQSIPKYENTHTPSSQVLLWCVYCAPLSNSWTAPNGIASHSGLAPAPPRLFKRYSSASVGNYFRLAGSLT